MWGLSSACRLPALDARLPPVPTCCADVRLPLRRRRASDRCQREKRKTVNGDDLLWAMSTLGFEEYVEPLKAYLAKFREAEKLALAAGNASKASQLAASHMTNGTS